MNPPPEPDGTLPWMRDLIVSMRGIAESFQRTAKTVEALKEKESFEVALFLRLLTQKSHLRCEPGSSLHLDLVRHRKLFDRLGYEKISEIYGHATNHNWLDVQLFLRSGKPSIASGEQMPEGFSNLLSGWTVGERKQRSRKVSGLDLEPLLFDSDRSVIRQLLMNPKLTEKNVVRIATRHEAPVAVLEEIFASNRWIPCYSVKKALAFNPQTPLPYAAHLVHHLRPADLRLLRKGGNVRAEIRELAAHRLQNP